MSFMKNINGQNLQFLLNKLAKGEDTVYSSEALAAYSSVKSNLYPEPHPTIGRIQFELFGEYPLSESQLAEWDQVRGLFEALRSQNEDVEKFFSIFDKRKKPAYPLITECGLDGRSVNTLRAMGVVTIDEASQFNSYDIMRMRGASKMTVYHIDKKLGEFGLSLGLLRNGCVNKTPVSFEDCKEHGLGLTALICVNEEDMKRHFNGVGINADRVRVVYIGQKMNSYIFLDYIVTEEAHNMAGFSKFEDEVMKRVRRIV